jgi:hypothetical protein
MPGRYLKKLGEDIDAAIHRLANEASIITANLDFLEQQGLGLQGEHGAALGDAAKTARQLAETVRALQALVG